jgi:hypothetical protein
MTESGERAVQVAEPNWRMASRVAAIVAASLVVHWLIAMIGFGLPNITPFNDVNLYSDWVERGLAVNKWPGTNEPGVYPALALLPMIFAQWIDGSNAINGWLILMTLSNTVALVAIGRAPRGGRAAAYWLMFMLLLGPVAIGRIDAVAVTVDAFVVLAVLRGQGRLAMGLATAGAWIKIWPAASALALLVREGSRERLARSVGVALAVSVGVLAFGVALGGNENLFSFLWLMGNRGLQLESVAATPWLWGAHLGWGDSSVYFESNIITFQVTGPGADIVSKLMLPALVIAVAITALLGVRAARAGANPTSVFVLTALTATLDLIVFNKVGSPQFEAWLAIPIVAGLLAGTPRWRIPLILGLVIAALTQWVYPLNYDSIVNAELFGIALLGLRNALLIALLVWANLRLGALSKPALAAAASESTR